MKIFWHSHLATKKKLLIMPEFEVFNRNRRWLTRVVNMIKYYVINSKNDSKNKSCHDSIILGNPLGK